MNSAPNPSPTMATRILLSLVINSPGGFAPPDPPSRRWSSSARPRGRLDGPADGVQNQLVKRRVAPDALVVAVRRVEHAPFPLVAHPRPGLATGGVHALHEHEPIGVVLRMYVGLVPHLEGRQAGHDRMVRLDDLRRELSGPVLLELRSDEGDVGR